MHKLKNHPKIQKWLPLLVLSSALMIIIIDTTVLNVSIRNILQDLDTNVQAIQWVISAYSLTLAALTITGGRLGDLYGRLKMFRVGAVLFALGSSITSFAPTITWVIIGNAIVEGIGAALMMPATSSLLVSNYKGKDRALAFAIWGAVAASAAAIGPILGGWLTTNYSWRWAFRINLIVVVALLVGSRYIKQTKLPKISARSLDFLGIALSSIGLTSIVYGLIESSTYGWWKATQSFELFGHSATPLGLSVTPVTIFIGLTLITVFAYHEYKRETNGKTPLVSLGLFKNLQFTSGALTTAIMAIGQTGLIFAIPIFYQSVAGLDAFHTGLGLIPMSLAIMFGAPVGLKMTRWLTPKRVIQLGFMISAVGILILHQTLNIDSTPIQLAPGLFLYGIGMGFGFSHLGNLTLSAISVKQSGEASGVNNTLRQIGSSFGSAIIGAALIATLTSSISTELQSSTVIPDNQKPAIIKQVEAAGSNIEFIQPSDDTNVPAAISNEIEHAAHVSTVKGNKISLLITGSFTIAALLFSNLLPNYRNLEKSEEASITSH